MKKVLIMEDELNIRSFVVINLKRAGYDAIEAGNGQEARMRRQTSKPSMSPGTIISRMATPMSGV